jgi:HAD superfamily hydrolase (TIGR01490 family)
MQARRVAVFDLDGTITRVDTYVHFLLAVMRHHPTKALLGSWLPLAAAAHRLGWRDNAWLKRAFLGTIIGGMRRQQLEAIVEPFVEGIVQRHVRAGARAALRDHRAAGDRVVLATASLDFYVVSLARRLGADEIVCTESVWSGERLTDGLGRGNCYGEEKLRRLIALLGATESRPYVYAYADHYSDRALLDWADKGIAVNPDPLLREYCRVKGYPVVDWERGEGQAH